MNDSEVFCAPDLIAHHPAANVQLSRPRVVGSPQVNPYRSSLTVVIDVYSRMVLGFAIYLEKPSAFTERPFLRKIGILIGGLVAGSGGKETVKSPLAFAAAAASVVWVLYLGSTWLDYPETIGANGPNGLIDQFRDRATNMSTVVSGTLAYLSQKRSDKVSIAPPPADLSPVLTPRIMLDERSSRGLAIPANIVVDVLKTFSPISPFSCQATARFVGGDGY